MSNEELVQDFIGRLSQARLSLEQGLGASSADSLKKILAEIEEVDLQQSAREEIRSLAESMLNSIDEHSETETLPGEEFQDEEIQATNAAQYYHYGVALMDGQFWEEAIQELNMAAGLGFERLKCWEYCGDCAFHLEKWEDSFRFYEYVYSDESLTNELKNTILTKITKCSQAQKKKDGHYPKDMRTERDDQRTEADFVDSSILSLDTGSIHPAIGSTVSSWAGAAATAIAGRTHSYRITDLLHVGSSSLIVELEEQGSGKKYAGQSLSGPAEALPPEKLAAWVQRQMAFRSRHLVRTYDLAGEAGRFYIVREHLPLSLSNLLTTSASMPVTLAVRLAYQVLEALGDLHLHMTEQGVVRNQFHLDLRPSRVLLRRDKPYVKVYNGGLWAEIDKTGQPGTNLKDLPLPCLAYRAPEQFRTYLARKRPPAFTDIYLFGALFYEMLTGAPAFKASSFGEYEIQHCEQYPSPPKVWRPEIPEVLNELIMKCLATDPIRRFRSSTQISLILEKSFPAEVARPRDDSYQRYLRKLNI